MKVYMHNDKIYCHKVNEQDNEYNMAISPLIVLQDGKPLYAFVLQDDADKYCNARNEAKDGHTYEVRPFMFYEKHPVGNTMYIYKLVFDVQGKVCWKSVDKTCATNESMSFYYDENDFKHIVGIFKDKDESHFNKMIEYGIDACMNLTEN